jgi:broad specificity phosphatase PhoE
MTQSTLSTLSLAPVDCSVTVVMRHAEREEISDNSDWAVLSKQGEKSSETFGVELAARYRYGRILSSPVIRCLETASAISRGAKWSGTIVQSKYLNHPYVQRVWEDLPSHNRSSVLPPEVWELTGLMVTSSAVERSIHVLITHDTILGTLLGYLLRYPIDSTNWPEYLEGIVFWRLPNRVFAAWRGQIYDITDRIRSGN